MNNEDTESILLDKMSCPCACFPERMEFPDWNQLTKGLAIKKESSHEHRPITLRQLWLAMALSDVSKKLYHHPHSRTWRFT